MKSIPCVLIVVALTVAPASGDTISVTNEAHTLTTGQLTTLNQPNAIASSIVVTDSFGTTLYSEFIDYLVIQRDSVTEIQRQPTGAIPNGGAVLVSYEYEEAIHYVDISNATPSAPYTSWATAATNIQKAINAASSNDTVLVTNGIYSTGGALVSNMLNRVVLNKDVTVQSVNGPDYTFIVGEGPAGSNAVRCAYLTEGAQLIGFTLTDGGGHPVSFLVEGTNEIFNTAGGVMLTKGGYISDCVVSGNSAAVGGGVLCFQGGTLENCTISSNAVSFVGGGVICFQGGTLNNCTISANFSEDEIGGVDCFEGGVLSNCTISSNTSSNWIGGASLGDGGKLINCTISGNASSMFGGVGVGEGGTVIDCIIEGNSAIEDGGGVGGGDGSGIVNNCTIRYNSANRGGGIHTLMGSEIHVMNCTISSNFATNSGGGIHSLKGRFDSCMISQNTSTDGGGVLLEGGDLNSCVISSNSAIASGGGVHSVHSLGALNNCTITSNSAGEYGSGVFLGELTLNNCIVWDNYLDENWYGSGGSCTNNCTTPTKGINCVTSDPLFVAVGDYHLQSNSPCIDAGVYIGEDVDDMEGIQRPLDGNNDGSALFDIGAYEYLIPTADSDGDGLTDGDELGIGTSPANANTDGDPANDYEEYVADTDGTDSSDWFRILFMSNVTMYYQSSSNRQYTLYWCTDLVDDYWGAVRGQTDIMGSGGVDSLTDSYNEPHIDPACFYKVEVKIP